MENKLLQDITYLRAGVITQLNTYIAAEKAAIKDEKKQWECFFRGKKQMANFILNSLDNLINKENKRIDRVRKFGEKKVGRPKKHSITQKDVNKYAYL